MIEKEPTSNSRTNLNLYRPPPRASRPRNKITKFERRETKMIKETKSQSMKAKSRKDPTKMPLKIIQKKSYMWRRSRKSPSPEERNSLSQKRKNMSRSSLRRREENKQI